MNRRSFLGGIGAATLAGLAGCADLVSEEDRTPETTTTGPSFADPTVRVPGDPTVGDDLQVAVAVTNEGGATGTFTGTLELTGPRNSTRSVAIDGVEPGETGSTTVTVDLDYAGTYAARLPGTDASTEFAVGPREAEPGTAATLDGDLQFAVEDARVEPTLVAEGRGPLHLDGAAGQLGGIPHTVPATDPGDAGGDHPAAALPDDTEVVLLVVEATVTNEGEAARTVDPGRLATRAAIGDAPTFFTDMDRELNEGIAVADLEATIGTPPLAGATVEAGETRRGWLLAPVARETASQGAIEVGIQHDSSGGSVSDADGSGPPETVWRVVPEGGTDLPEFEVRNLTVPSEIPNLTTGEFWVVVENVGDAPGTYRDVLEMTGNHEWDPVGRITGEVAPGETAGLTGEFYMAYAGLQGLDLQRGEVEATEELHRHGAEEAQATCVGSWLELPFPYEGTLELTNGTRLSFRDFAYAEAYDLTRRSGVSNRVLLVDLVGELPGRAVGQGVGDQMLPELDDFARKVHPDWEPEKPLDFGFGPLISSTTIVDPVEGPLYPPEPPEQPDDGQLSGWIPLPNVHPDSERFDFLPREKRETRLTTTVKYSARGWAKHVRVKWSRNFD